MKANSSERNDEQRHEGVGKDADRETVCRSTILEGEREREEAPWRHVTRIVGNERDEESKGRDDRNVDDHDVQQSCARWCASTWRRLRLAGWSRQDVH